MWGGALGGAPRLWAGLSRVPHVAEGLLLVLRAVPWFCKRGSVHAIWTAGSASRPPWLPAQVPAPRGEEAAEARSHPGSITLDSSKQARPLGVV